MDLESLRAKAKVGLEAVPKKNRCPVPGAKVKKCVAPDLTNLHALCGAPAKERTTATGKIDLCGFHELVRKATEEREREAEERARSDLALYADLRKRLLKGFANPEEPKADDEDS